MKSNSEVISRKKRVFAKNSGEMQLLGRSAAQLARTSANRMRATAVVGRLEQFAKLTAIENACKMMRADILVRLVDEDELRPIDIARETGLRQSDLSEMYKTAKAFPPGSRPDGIPYNLFLLSSRMMRKFPSLKIPPKKALERIRRLGFSQHRDVSRHFATLARATESRRAVFRLGQGAARATDKQTYCSPFQDIVEQVADGSAKIIHIDPPYVYCQTADGRYPSTSLQSLVCDNHTAGAAITLVADLLRDWRPKLTPGGVLLLWQLSGPLLMPIIESIERFNWVLDGPIIWDKGRAQPGDFDSPYSTQTEMLWMLSRRGDVPVNHDGSSRSDILRFPPVSFPGLAQDQQHCFEKPQALCEFLIGKHSYPGELVVDLCGCTGSMSMAAIATGRNWIYVESNRKNFRLGSSRIGQYLAGLAAAAI